MKRTIKQTITGYRTQDGAGVSLVRVLGNRTVDTFDPILMLDSFDSTNPDDYTAGFPMHPHRGIETISYVYKGKMKHRDNLGNEDEISDGEIQWMNSGSGILHEEQVPAADRLLGVQLWLNLPAKSKMSKPTYHSIKNNEIPEVEFDGGKLRVLAGDYNEVKGYKGDHLPLDYYDIHLNANSTITLHMDNDASLMLFTLLGEVHIGDTLVNEKTAVKLSQGDETTLTTGDTPAQVLYMKSIRLDEPVAWAGPIVMNTEEEIDTAFKELRSDSFVKESVDY